MTRVIVVDTPGDAYSLVAGNPSLDQPARPSRISERVILVQYHLLGPEATTVCQLQLDHFETGQYATCRPMDRLIQSVDVHWQCGCPRHRPLLETRNLLSSNGMSFGLYSQFHPPTLCRRL